MSEAPREKMLKLTPPGRTVAPKGALEPDVIFVLAAVGISKKTRSMTPMNHLALEAACFQQVPGAVIEPEALSQIVE
jgi:hypothetical protein